MTMQEIAQRIRAEAKKEHKWELGIGGRDQEMMLAAWETMRPKMLAALRKQGVEKLLARLLEERAMEEMSAQMGVYLPPTDAQEQSEQNWYLMEPEEGTPEEDLEALLQMIEAGGKQELRTSSPTHETAPPETVQDAQERPRTV